MSKYVEVLDERLKKDNPSYAEENKFLFMKYAPSDYYFEDEMLEYLTSHPDATLDEVYDYFDANVPDGLAPDDDGADLLDED